MAEKFGPRVLTQKVEKKVVIDAWGRQGDLLWRTVYATPAIATAIFAGWFAVRKESTPLANFVLLAGISMMILQGLIVYRMARYLNFLRRAVGDALPRVTKATVPFTCLALPEGNQLAVSVPIVLGLLFLVMLVLSLAGI